MKLKSFSLDPVDIRLTTTTTTASGSIGDRSGLVLRLDADGEVSGHGEAAPIPGRTAVGLDRMAGDLTAWAESSVGVEIDTLVEGLDQTALAGQTRFAIHSALIDLQSTAAGVPLHQFLRAGSAGMVMTNALVTTPTAAEVHKECSELRSAGFTAVKLKVGAMETARDITRIIAASEACGPAIELRLDANRAWTREQVEHVVGRVGPRRLGYIEDPTSTPTEYGAITEATEVATGLDIADAEAEDFERLFADSGAAVLVVKAAALGGIDKILGAARRLSDGQRLVVTSSIDGQVGLLAGLHVAAALPRAEIHGLATAAMVVGLPPVLQPVNGAVSLGDKPGLGQPLD